MAEKGIKLTIERTALYILGFSLFCALLIYRVFASSPSQPYTEVSHLRDIADGIIVVLLLAGSAMALTKSFLNREVLPRTAVDIPVIVLFAASALSLFYSVDKQLTAAAVVTLAANIAAFYALTGLLNSNYRIKVFLMLLIGAGLMVSLLGLIHYFFIYKEIFIGGLPKHIKHAVQIKRIGSLLGWPNLLAGFLLLILPIAATSIFSFKDKKDKFCMAIASGVLFIMTFLTYSISSWVSLMLGSAIVAIFFLRKENGGRTNKRFWFFAAVIAAFLIFLLIFILAKRYNAYTSHSFTTRLEYLRVAAYMIKTRPFLGSGLDTFGKIDYYLASSPYTFSNYAHNSYMQIFAETGIAGFAAIIGIVFCSLRYGALKIKSIKDGKERLLFIGLLWAITSFLIDNLFNVTILYPQTSVFFWATLAIMFSFGRLYGEGGASNG